jgi:predicted solute-binding protein
MFGKKKAQQVPQKISRIEEMEDESNDDILEQPIQSPKPKKKEVYTEQEEEEESLTEEMVKQYLQNLSYRIGRIEHYLRLDY